MSDTSLTDHVNPATGFPVPIDMTQIIHFDKMVEEVRSVNALTGPYYMSEFLKAMNVALSYQARAINEYERAVQESKRAFAVAMLDKAPEALKEKGLRVNEEFCKQYAHSDPDYIKCKEYEGYWKALVTLLSGKYERFRCAHDDAKKVYDVVKDPLGQYKAISSSKDSESL